MLEKIELNGINYALILRGAESMDGIKFFTSPSDSMQLGYMNRPCGYKISPHIHKPVPRMVEFTYEVLFLKSGRVKVNFFNDDHVYVADVILCSGDVVLLLQGGHGFEMLEDSEIIEVKQGPYAGENDKVRF